MAGPGPLTGPVCDHCRGNGLPKNSPPSSRASVVNTGAATHRGMMSLWDDMERKLVVAYKLGGDN
eukprot:16412540-Heterocapsa_arctica.AAC.1